VARRWFRKTILQVACGDEAHTITLMPSGRLKLNNHNEQTVEAFMAFGAKKPRCLDIRDAFYSGDVGALPPELAGALHATLQRLRKAAHEALESADYREPSERWVDRAGTDYDIKVTASPSLETIYTEAEAVWHSKFGKRKYPGTALTIYMMTSVPAYIEVLRYMPKGLAYLKDGTALAVVAIRKVNRVKRKVDSLVALVGKQGRGLHMMGREALLRRDDEGDWVVKKWL
jgi:hypothetical protein